MGLDIPRVESPVSHSASCKHQVEEFTAREVGLTKAGPVRAAIPSARRAWVVAAVGTTLRISVGAPIARFAFVVYHRARSIALKRIATRLSQDKKLVSPAQSGQAQPHRDEHDQLCRRDGRESQEKCSSRGEQPGCWD